MKFFVPPLVLGMISTLVDRHGSAFASGTAAEHAIGEKDKVSGWLRRLNTNSHSCVLLVCN
jgi:hypothetical protein